VDFDGGVAGATHTWDNNWLPANAFRKNRPVDKAWHSGKSGSNFPIMIWYDFKSRSIDVAEMSFQPGQSKAEYLGKTPTSYQFVGSNDKVCNDSATWAVLCEDLSNRPWTRYSEVRYCKVKPEVKKKFRCFGIRVLNNRVTSGQTNMRNIRFWERIVNTQKDEL